MITKTFWYIFNFLFLVLLQVMVLDNIQFLDFANPYIYILFIITLPCSLSREIVLLIGFILGFSVDMFNNTYGIHAFASVLAAFSRYYLLRFFEPRDDYEEITPSISSFGLGNFTKYATLTVLIHHTALFFIDFSSFYPISTILLRILLSSVFTMLLIMGVEWFKGK